MWSLDQRGMWHHEWIFYIKSHCLNLGNQRPCGMGDIKFLICYRSKPYVILLVGGMGRWVHVCFCWKYIIFLELFVLTLSLYCPMTYVFSQLDKIAVFIRSYHLSMIGNVVRKIRIWLLVKILWDTVYRHRQFKMNLSRLAYLIMLSNMFAKNTN